MTAYWHRLGLGLAVLGSLGNPAIAQEKPAIIRRAEACLHQNVDRVVRSEPDLFAAANFLVEFACAKEVAGAAKYERNIQAVAAVGAMSSNMGAAFGSTKTAPAFEPVHATVDPDSGEVVMDKSSNGAFNPLGAILPQVGNASALQTVFAVPVSLRTLASDLVMTSHEQMVSKTR